MTESDRAQHDHFLRLFMEHEDSLRVFVRSLLFSHDEEREVMQEVAVVLWRKFDAGMDSQSFCRWAFGVARMEALAFRRDRARDRHTFGDEVFELLGQMVLEQSDALEAERRALGTCLQKVPEEQRRFVQAAYAPGAKMDELTLTVPDLAPGTHDVTLFPTLARDYGRFRILINGEIQEADLYHGPFVKIGAPVVFRNITIAKDPPLKIVIEPIGANPAAKIGKYGYVFGLDRIEISAPGSGKATH